MLNGVRAFSKLNPALALIAIYALCTGAGFILWIAMGFLDLAAGTRVLVAAIHVMEGLNEHVLPALQLLNGSLALLMGFFILLGRIHININVNSNRSRPNPNKMSTLSCRSKMIGALPKGKYGCLRRSDDANRNDSSSSSCAICLGGIGEEDGVRILPNCRHYFHISCIDRWLLPCTVNNSSCPLCRATVIGLHSSQAK
uniref:RING-type domain-containing protein n=1 Tax=Picea sitchensis TaxID=3332 RepID=A9P1W7_PICSI|nr:unknown [Picea sitchensis]